MATNTRPLAALQALHVAVQLVDPHRHLEPERGWHRVLAVGAAGEQDVLRPLGKVGQRGENGGELAEEYVVGPAHLEELARLGDVLSGGAPVHVTAGISSQARSSAHTSGTSG